MSMHLFQVYQQFFLSLNYDNKCASFKLDKLLPTETHGSSFEQNIDSLINTLVLGKLIFQS